MKLKKLPSIFPLSHKTASLLHFSALLSINLTLGHKKKGVPPDKPVFKFLKLTLNLKLTNKPLKHLLKQSTRL